jgi:hypothetical protein
MNPLPFRSRPSARHAGRRRALWLWVVAGSLLALAAPVVYGQDGTLNVPAPTVEVPLTVRPHALALGASGLPRASMEIDGRPGTGSSLAASVLPRIAGDERFDPGSVRVHYVRWAPAGRAGSVGVSLGLASDGLAPRSDAAFGEPGRTRPEVGVHWRSRWTGERRVDVAAWSALDGGGSAASPDRRDYNARVELQFQAAKRAMGFDVPRGAFGMQLSSHSQMLLRAHHGGPMVYYRTQW